ncbi:MAG: type II secretion system inner membrane protein GspF [Gammaproteobacteria bacterium]|nr:type II secretion system inner membrane protein GspF [Gammaproteobacteria bacterium]
MAGFEYQALDSHGRAVRGVIDGDAERQVRGLLRERGLTPLSVAAIRDQPNTTASGTRTRSFSRRGISGSELALLTRQFATLVRAGMTLEECLNALIEQSEKARTRNVLAGVRGRMLEGQSLARSMGAFPQAFPDIYRVMVDAGEQSGKLVEVLERLADYTENRQALRQKVMLAFIYPVILVFVAISVVSLLLVYVVPQVTRVFQNTGQVLPLATRLLISVSDGVRAGGSFILLGVIGSVIAFVLALRNPVLKERWHLAMLKLPVVGRMARGINAARFADTLGILTASGIPLLQALQSAVPVVNNLPMRRGVEDALKQVREGGSLSRALAKSKLFPPLVVHLVASGETSGRLDVMLQRAAEAQARELENWVKALTALLEPVMILVMGGLVLFIVIAILLPIFEMNQLVK